MMEGVMWAQAQLGKILYMDGHGIYVWPTFLIVALALGLLAWLPQRAISRSASARQNRE